MWGQMLDSEQLESVYFATILNPLTFCQSNIITIYGINNWSTEKFNTQVAYLLQNDHFLFKEDTAHWWCTVLRTKCHQFRAKTLVKVIQRVYFYKKGNYRAKALFLKINSAFVCFVGAVTWFCLKACITGEFTGSTRVRYESPYCLYIKHTSWKEANWTRHVQAPQNIVAVVYIWRSEPNTE